VTEALTKAERSTKRILEDPLGPGILRFGFPLVVGMFLYTTFNLIDMFIISRLENSAAALGALGICDMVAALPTIISNGVSTGTVAIISRRMGEGDRAGAAEATWQSLLLVGVLSIIFGIIGLFFSPFVIHNVMQAKGEVAELASAYLQIAMGGAFSIFFLLQITSILRAYGHSKSAAILLVSGNVLNVILNLVLVYGPGPTPDYFAFAQPVAVALGIPRMGLMGTAWATLIGRTIPVIIGLILLARRVRGGRPGFAVLHPEWKMLSRLVKIGWPSSAQLVVRIGAILVFLSLINSNYTTAADAHTLTAYSICLRLETLVLFLGMGWGAAASTYMGTNLGANHRRRAHISGWIAALYNAVLTAVMVGLFIEYSDSILGFFEKSPPVLEAGREYLRYVAPSYVMVAIGVVLSQSLSGAGATFASLVLDASVLIFGVIPAAIIVTETVQAAPPGLWITMALGNVLIAAAFAMYYARGKFLDKKI
jgi:putative MATE family efflux protein